VRRYDFNWQLTLLRYATEVPVSPEAESYAIITPHVEHAQPRSHQRGAMGRPTGGCSSRVLLQASAASNAVASGLEGVELRAATAHREGDNATAQHSSMQRLALVS
jgi:hypothetical protein